LVQHGADLHELFAREARLAPEVGSLIALLGMLDARPLSGLGGLSLGLGRSGRRVPDDARPVRRYRVRD
jgi:hypothetical protein